MINPSYLRLFLKLSIILIPLVVCVRTGLAQNSNAASKTAATKIYILPDGRKIGPDKLDSLGRAWGADRIMSKHNDEDDAKGIVYLERMTDQMMRDMNANVNSQTKILDEMTGQQAADFTLTDLAGNEVHLAALKGKVVVVNFWFTACPPCIAEMPALNKLVTKYQKDQVVFLALTFNDKKLTKSFLQDHTYNYTIVPNAQDAISKYGIHNYPTHLVIGKDGRLKNYFATGENIEQQLSTAIDRQKS